MSARARLNGCVCDGLAPRAASRIASQASDETCLQHGKAHPYYRNSLRELRALAERCSKDERVRHIDEKIAEIDPLWTPPVDDPSGRSLPRADDSSERPPAAGAHGGEDGHRDNGAIPLEPSAAGLQHTLQQIVAGFFALSFRSASALGWAC